MSYNAIKFGYLDSVDIESQLPDGHFGPGPDLDETCKNCELSFPQFREFLCDPEEASKYTTSSLFETVFHALENSKNKTKNAFNGSQINSSLARNMC